MTSAINTKNLFTDIFAGMVVGLISIPISMGYAQIAGLPAVYGLYGSVFPVLVYALITSSHHAVFGVDATPAALAGGFLAEMGVTAFSQEALKLVPVVALFVSAWLIFFYLIKAGRVVRYISAPVMGGFISGIGLTIILMQIPKLFGGGAGYGEIFDLMPHIASQAGSSFHLLSFVLGLLTIILINVSKKINPRFPMSVILLILGAFLTGVLHTDRMGVMILPEVKSGIPLPSLPSLAAAAGHIRETVVISLTIAVVVMAQTLLTANSFAGKYDERIVPDRELLAYGLSNLTGVFFGCPPLNGSVSRTGLGDQYGAKSQLMSVSAVVTMALVLLFGTDILTLLPVPVLTGIVISALMSILDVRMAKMLFKTDKREFGIFMGAFFGVLIFGTIYGVIIGVVLSFADVLIRTISVPRAYLGIIPGQNVFYNMARYRESRPVKNTLIYRFSGNLCFANIDTLESDIEVVVESEKDTEEPIRIIVVDARGVGSIDSVSAERLLKMYRKYSSRGIKFYITEHPGFINDSLRMYGAGELVAKGVVRRTITLALRDAGLRAPYDYSERLDSSILFPDPGKSEGQIRGDSEIDSRRAELEWAFGDSYYDEMKTIASEWMSMIIAENASGETDIMKAESNREFGRVGLFDEDEILKILDGMLDESTELSDNERSKIKTAIENRRSEIAERVRAIRL